MRRCQQSRGYVRDVADNLAIPRRVALADIADDDHARRDADPTPHPCGGSQVPDRRTQFEPGVDRVLAVVLTRLGVTEQDERVIPEMPIDNPCMARGGLRDAAPEVRDCLVQVFETRAAGGRFHAGQFARESGDLAALGLAVPDRHGVPLRAGLRWHCCDGVPLSWTDRTDVTIAATRHRLDPTVPARRLAQRPTQRGDLNGKIAVLDHLVGPRGLDQRIFRNQRAGPFDQGPQQGNCSQPDRDGFVAAEQQAARRVQAKWTQLNHHVSY